VHLVGSCYTDISRCTVKKTLRRPEDGWSRAKHVAKYHLIVIIASCLMYVLYWQCIIFYTDLMIHNGMVCLKNISRFQLFLFSLNLNLSFPVLSLHLLFFIYVLVFPFYEFLSIYQLSVTSVYFPDLLSFFANYLPMNVPYGTVLIILKFVGAWQSLTFTVDKLQL